LTRIGERWVIYTQGLGEHGRTVMAFHSDDLDVPPWQWTREVVWTLRDKYPHLQTHHGIKPWSRPGLTIGVYGVFLNRTELMDTTVDLGFALSHDGFDWREPWPRTTLLRRGPAGEWDSTFLTQGFPGFVNVGDRTYFYYGGNPTGNIGHAMDIGLATLRRDGFGYLGIEVGWTYAGHTGARDANFTTVPIRLHDSSLDRVLLNIDNVGEDAEQWVRVELLDARGKPLRGFTLADADPITENAIAVSATWRGEASLSALQEDVIRLRVHLHGGRYRRKSPKLYAVYFRKPDPIEQ